MKTQKLKRDIESEIIHAAHPRVKDPFGTHVMPIYQTSTFTFDSVEAGRKLFAHEEGGATHAYSRLANPTVEALERALARLEGHGLPDAETVQALAFGSGMAAITTGLLAFGKGRHIIAQEALYGCTSQFLTEEAPEMGLQVTLIDPSDLDHIAHLLEIHGERTLIYLESMANPTMTIADIREISAMAHRYGALVMVDNTFATPYHMRPMEQGADIVVHSTTKYLSGHGTIIGGALVARGEIMEEYSLGLYRKNLGGIASPFDAWLTLNGLKTFMLRMERHAENAQKVAEFLDQHPSVEKVHYPGLPSGEQFALAQQIFEKGYGGVLSFELRGGYDAGVYLMEHVELCTLAVSLGNIDTLIQHPASMTHSVMDPEVREKAGITDGLVRLSVGLEKVEDIIADLEEALPVY